ncbi:hypothetical protein PHYPO_G00091440 [Pangasianodon hypophthalmus]|uniref:Uncharacterized protein n=1 Tax=Pangasianodon hypophthalmus TaxID=310915 RepID=A0A5N5LAZ1_PANHP|nr:hypothetical protein PHYPO_G00091440 [Pangasianodon hypophthalmus]
MRKNKLELPSELRAMKKKKVTSSMFAFTDRAAVISYCSVKGKNVLLMSTMNKDAVRAPGKTENPKWSWNYNETKGGIDNLDKVTAIEDLRGEVLNPVASSGAMDMTKYHVISH